MDCDPLGPPLPHVSFPLLDVLATEGGLHLLSPSGWEDASAWEREFDTQTRTRAPMSIGGKPIVH